MVLKESGCPRLRADRRRRLSAPSRPPLASMSIYEPSLNGRTVIFAVETCRQNDLVVAHENDRTVETGASCPRATGDARRLPSCRGACDRRGSKRHRLIRTDDKGVRKIPCDILPLASASARATSAGEAPDASSGCSSARSSIAAARASKANLHCKQSATKRLAEANTSRFIFPVPCSRSASCSCGSLYLSRGRRATIAAAVSSIERASRRSAASCCARKASGQYFSSSAIAARSYSLPPGSSASFRARDAGAPGRALGRAMSPTMSVSSLQERIGQGHAGHDRSSPSLYRDGRDRCSSVFSTCGSQPTRTTSASLKSEGI